MKGFETFEHGADVGIRGYGKTMEEAFSEVLKALSTLYVERINFDELTPSEEREVELGADGLDELLVYFVNRAITLASLEGIIFLGFKGRVHKEEEVFRLRGVLLVYPLQLEKFGLGVEVKGATFTLAKVEREEGGWIAQCVVDV